MNDKTSKSILQNIWYIIILTINLKIEKNMFHIIKFSFAFLEWQDGFTYSPYLQD
jgi:hypothetical protein